MCKEFFFKIFIYLFMGDIEREREAETQAEGEAGSMQGAGRGTQSRVSRITPWIQAAAKPLLHRAAQMKVFLHHHPLTQWNLKLNQSLHFYCQCT